MKRSALSLMLLAALASPALADVCSAATEAATAAALQSAEASGRRTATVRVTCEGERKTLILHRVGTGASASITVREVTPAAGPALKGAPPVVTKIIRVGE